MSSISAIHRKSLENSDDLRPSTPLATPGVVSQQWSTQEYVNTPLLVRARALLWLDSQFSYLFLLWHRNHDRIGDLYLFSVARPRAFGSTACKSPGRLCRVPQDVCVECLTPASRFPNFVHGVHGSTSRGSGFCTESGPRTTRRRLGRDQPGCIVRCLPSELVWCSPSEVTRCA